ncbi:MAG: hypothetical protein B7Y82_13160 [Sphingomonadales bacterium 32-65-25]|nr:MAG: hypothetical protein B7Y82_13160 [Sphingomonadales bacterium 32-65-25]
MKKFAYFAAVSVVIIAQAASAQDKPEQSQIPVSKPGPAIDRAVTLTAVSAKPTPKVTLADGKVWQFSPGPKGTYKGATVAGIAVDPSKLTVGMSCVLNGSQKASVNVIVTLACK